MTLAEPQAKIAVSFPIHSAEDGTTGKGQNPAHPREVRRMQAVMRVIPPLGMSVIALAVCFGNAPRPVVNGLNVVQSGVVIVMLGVAVHALYRFRRACLAWQNGHRR